MSDLLQCTADQGFTQWMSQLPGSLAITTYQAGKVVMVGFDGRQVTVLPRQFDKPMGLAVLPAGPEQPTRMALATRNHVIQFTDAPRLAPGFFPNEPGRYDGCLLPRLSHHTGDLNVHDIAYTADGLCFVNTRFCCLARLSEDYSFAPVWKPPFVSDIVPEDRCHLNGLCVVNGHPKYVTCLSETDTVGGWRERKASGGVIVDVVTNQVLARGLSMPHSPRWHADQLWVLNSGTGELWAIDPKNGRHVIVCALPGYLRGLCLTGPYALTGLCQIREKHIFGDLPVQKRHQKLLCGIGLIDLRCGRQVGFLEFTAGCQELFEVQLIPGLRRPMLVNLEREESRQAFPAPGFSYWLRPASQVTS